MDLNTLLMAFGGGVVGAAFGGVWSFVLCGFFALAGIATLMAGGSGFILLDVAIGPLFGPHVGFCGAIAAGCYLAGKNRHPGGAAKDILSPLVGTSWEALVVGGIFGSFGALCVQVVGKIPILNLSDAIAVTVVVSNALARLVFLKQAPWGSRESIRKIGYLKTDNLAIAWLPWLVAPSVLVALGLGTGLFAGAAALAIHGYLTPLVAKGAVDGTAAFLAAALFGWGIGAIGFILLNVGTGTIQKAPVVHVIALEAGIAAVFSGSILVGGLFGVITALVQELMARMLYNHGSSHIDPPAAAAAVVMFILSVLKTSGLLG